MNKTFDQLTATSVESQEQAIGLIEKLMDVAKPGAVFSQPMTVEGRTIITASEVNVGLGVGFGFGGGTTPAGWTEEKKGTRRQHAEGADPHERVELEGSGAEEGEADDVEPETGGEDAGMGGGGGGGGGASGRPVAVISVSEDGVTVEPVVDATKIALAFFTALGSMFFMLVNMRRAAER
jgi:uncharacterized spore protein YtfJ